MDDLRFLFRNGRATACTRSEKQFGLETEHPTSEKRKSCQDVQVHPNKKRVMKLSSVKEDKAEERIRWRQMICSGQI